MVETTLAYIFKDDEILMLYRNKKKEDVHEGKWNGLGGHVELGETALECIKREVYEESGLTLLDPLLLGVCYFPNFNLKAELMYIYIAKQFSGMMGECNEGELYWKSTSEIMDLNVWESDKVFLPSVLSERFFTGTFYYDGFEYIKSEFQEVDETKLQEFILNIKDAGCLMK